MKKISFLFLLLFFSTYVCADEAVADGDTLTTHTHKNDIFHRIGNTFTKYFRDFNKTDTTYIEPQHYNYALMLQNTNTYEMYRVTSKSGQSFLFAPEPTYRVGPYFGWRWIFLGYTIDVSHIGDKNNKQEWDISLYSNLVTVDLYYRKTGDDYKIRDVGMPGRPVNTRALEGVPFNGMNVGITGIDIYYIANHKKFSYPAAFSQSTVQRRSCGSALYGIGYTRHSIDLDFDRLQEVVSKNLPEAVEHPDVAKLDSGLMFNKVRYTNFSASGGYAYNWVFAHNWLFSGSLSLAVGYKRATGDLRKDELTILRDFSFKNVVLDATSRVGIVWNDTKWFAGMSAVLHSYNYRKQQFSTNNFFGSLNFYVGFNFNRKRGYVRNTKK
ncbi:MAG: DUF4421 domain-containing protein [Prevotella sp.]|nr:DUF4421 domain-containing protein [Prevotella sp.]